MYSSSQDTKEVSLFLNIVTQNHPIPSLSGCQSHHTLRLESANNGGLWEPSLINVNSVSLNLMIKSDEGG